ncbi:hypothetical protein RUMGNA_03905 [Mediterraneibacter gnavus ATCC 29149]|uniref:Uncharacterized protein n=1 Tax=Mediterraneibacter gnavus (strain ATCC 29149 / DSM 114966 / JCM 6515 / VPI C7-9) TaxID=411470 RepID=A7B8I3_MEDG7|nr:hypothetical protein RUMGNA_03905 [Mediterraneibacter gnavus ATCC 29149]
MTHRIIAKNRSQITILLPFLSLICRFLDTFIISVPWIRHNKNERSLFRQKSS